MNKFLPAVSSAGILGSIASLVGVSISNHRSNETADKTPTHKWNIKIPSKISAEVSCSGTIKDYRVNGMDSQSISVDLKWWLDLSDEDRKILGERGTLTKNGKVEIEQDGKKWDWWCDVESYGPGSLWISSNPRSSGLTLTVQYTITKGKVGLGTTREVSLTCNDQKLKIPATRGQRLYSENTWRGANGRYSKVGGGVSLKVGISLETCSNDREKQFECPLKVVTGNDLDWSTKITEKAIFTISH